MRSNDQIQYLYQLLFIFLLTFLTCFWTINSLWISLIIGLVSTFLLPLFYLKFFKKKIISRKNLLIQNGINKKGIIKSYTIKTNSWTETIIDNSRAAGYNQLIGQGELNRTEIYNNQSLIKLNIIVEGKEFHRSIQSLKDPTTLKMLLSLKKEVDVYFKPSNFEENYFNLEFLIN